MYSGDLSIEAQKKAISIGAQAYLFKPASEEGLNHVMQALESNVVADDMRKYTEEGERVVEQENTAEQQQQLAILENRTRNLARIVSQERKETAILLKLLEEKINTFLIELYTIKEQSSNHVDEDSEHKRIENELRIQLKTVRDRMKAIGMLSIFSTIIAVVATILHFI